MRWEIEGADVRSGETRTIQVEAMTAAHAEDLARQQGLLVASVRQRVISIDPEEATALEVIAAQVAPTAAVEYARPMDKDPLPDYRGLRMGARFLHIAALVCYAIGALTAIGLVFSFFPWLLAAAQSSSPFRLELLDNLIQAILSLWPLLAGVLLQAAAAACSALRDMARNSFPTEHSGGTPTS